MKKKMTILFTGILAALLSSGCAETAEPFVPETHPAYAEGEGGYLWAHMTHNNYYKLFYAVSRDAFNWTTLNDGRSSIWPMKVIRTSVWAPTEYIV